ncbi:MAG: HesA/MoeB/ThiF family protein [Firmicutes bacterium]|nr:HesA/MoeB/ThiF family protein [Bacillota bacterium]
MSDFIKPRYKRNLNALSAPDMQKLHNGKVCVVGAGGLGGYIVELLARIGVLHITVVDYDLFESGNLNRQLFSEESNMGSYKADAAIDRVARINSDVAINGIKEKLTQNNAPKIIAGHHVVMDALDNIQTRLMLANVCAKLNIPMIHGSIAGWYGQVACIFPGDGTLGKIFGGTKKEHGVENELGNLPFTASAVASVQCAECVKILTGKDVVKNSVIRIDLLNCEYDTISL